MEQTIFRHGSYEMRSHSEQRWAGVMDVLGVRWLYEPQTINTRHGWYLPDFYLPACGIFIEVKGPTPNLVEIDKAGDAEAATGCPVVFAHGDLDMNGLTLNGGLLTHYRNGKAAHQLRDFQAGARLLWRAFSCPRRSCRRQAAQTRLLDGR